MPPKILDLTSTEYNVRDERVQTLEEPFEQGQVRDLEASIEPPAVFRKALHGPFKGVDLVGSENLGMWKLMQGLTSMIPLNQYDLPIYIYRPDMLDKNRIITVLREFAEGQERMPELAEITAVLDASVLQLNYDQGFPVLPTGKVFWEQLPFETDDAHMMFLSFLELEGLRKLTDVEMRKYPTVLLQEHFHNHFWNYRAQAFDLYRIANQQRTRLNRMLSTEESHYRMAEKMTKKLDAYFDQLNLLDDDSEITPDKAVSMLDKLVGIQRVSAGLPRNGETKENNGGRRLVSPQQMIGNANDAGARSENAVDDDFDDILNDPDAIALAQELILKRQANGKMD